MSLHEATELEDLSPLANESDAALLTLQKETADCIAAWDVSGSALDAVDVAWYCRLIRIDNFLTLLLHVRYGCND